MKKILALVACLSLAASLAIGGSIAYLTDRDSEANVFTVGNVKIDLKEEFDQGAPIVPGAQITKKPTISNTGASNAWVWMTVAVPEGFCGIEVPGDEQGRRTDAIFPMLLSKEISESGNWTLCYDEDLVPLETEINEKTYTLMTLLYKNQLKPDETTTAPFEKIGISNLVDIHPDGSMHFVQGGDVKPMNWNIKEDGNAIVYVSAYAIQTEGFDTIEEAYAAYNAQWGENGGEYAPAATLIESADEFYEATVNGGSYVLTTDYKTSDSSKKYNSNRAYAVRDDKEFTIDMNGKTVDFDMTYQDGKNTGYTYLFTVAYNSKLTIDGNGTFNAANAEGKTAILYAQSTGEIVINSGSFNADNGIAVWAGNGAKITINGGSFVSTGSNDEELIYSSGGVIDIYGGFFHNTGWENRPVNVANANRGTGFINIYGGTFVNFDPSTGGDDPNNIKVAEGYKVVSQTQENGDIWYTVVAK